MNLKSYVNLLRHTGTVLLRLRNDRMIKQQRTVADAIDIHLSSYCKTEKGDREPGIVEIFKLADFYGMKPSELVALIQQTPADLDREKQLQLQVEELLKENKFLKDQIEAEIRKQA